MATPEALKTRARSFLYEAGLTEPERILTLPRLSKSSYKPSKSDVSSARSLLVKQRTDEPGFRRPDEWKRNFFKAKQWKEAQADVDTWMFSKHEVARVFGSIVEQEELPPVAVAYALLLQIPPISINELWLHFHDVKTEKGAKRFLPRMSSIALIPELAWLTSVTRAGHVDYIRLLCEVGVGQADMDRAFDVALSTKSVEAMKILLCAGAKNSSNRSIIREQIKVQDLELVTLLLSAPHAMTTDAWRSCIAPALQHTDPTILLRVLAHRPEVVCGTLLIESLEALNFASVVVVLAYATTNDVFKTVRSSACQLASQVEDDVLRARLFQVMAKSELLGDMLVLRQELVKDVRSRQIGLIDTLVKARVTVDVEPNNAIQIAMTIGDLGILEPFRGAVFTASVSPYLRLLPDSTSESETLHILDIFGQALGTKSIRAATLSPQLIRAVEKQQIHLTEKLLVLGASIEFENAVAVQVALEVSNFRLVEILLSSACSREALSSAIPCAMRLEPRSARLEGMRHLTGKGVLKQNLVAPLQTLANEDGEVDLELIKLLLRELVPLESPGWEIEGPLLAAIRRGHIPLLTLLCAVIPRKHTLSKVLPFAFDAIRTHGEVVGLRMMNLLLQKNMSRQCISQTLLEAIGQKSSLEVIRSLIDHGADVNQARGACFAEAIRSSNFRLLQVLSSNCFLTMETMESILSLATNPSYFNLTALELLLKSTQSVSTVINKSWTLGKFKGNPHVVAIVGCFMRNGLDVNLEGGSPLCLAVQQQNVRLLADMMPGTVSLASLTAAFRETTTVADRDIKRLMMRLLLEKAKSAEIGQSSALSLEIFNALKGRRQIFDLLLLHSANINIDRGSVVRYAAVEGSFDILDALLVRNPTDTTVTSALTAVVSSPRMTEHDKQAVFERLLNVGVVRLSAMSKMLSEFVKKTPNSTLFLPELFLARGAQPDIDALKVAVKSSSFIFFKRLAESSSSKVLVELFRCTQDQHLELNKKYWLYENALAKGISSNEKSEALLRVLETENDPYLCKLLLDEGADPGYKNGLPLALAFQHDSTNSAFLLFRYISSNEVANLAFNLARGKALLTNPQKLKFYQHLLQRHTIDQTSIERALLEVITSEYPDASVVELLLRSGANPNRENACCFIAAADSGAGDVFNLLCKLGDPDIPLILRLLLKHFADEREVAKWFKICLEISTELVLSGQNDLLFLCMRKFPNKTNLLELLLDSGMSTSAKTIARVCPHWKPETCTALIWALCSVEPRIDNDVIMALLCHGGNKALPTYSTPLSKASAAFLCLLDETRTEVLRALFILDKEELIQHTMLESKFLHLAAYPKVLEIDENLPENANELSLRIASMHVGNFEAFQMMKSENVPNDGMLHLAALLALPKFVKWFLDHGHEPNHKMYEYDMIVPLAIACLSKPSVSCKIGNKQSEFLLRQKKTLQILATHTDLDFKNRGKTILHFAFEGGQNVTKIMVQILKIHHDKKRDEKYIYVDRSGIHYSPDQYVKRILKVETKTEKDILKILKDCRMKTRYYKNIKPTEGEQPDGYAGLPGRLQALWSDYEKTRRPPTEHDIVEHYHSTDGEEEHAEGEATSPAVDLPSRSTRDAVSPPYPADGLRYSHPAYDSSGMPGAFPGAPSSYDHPFYRPS